LLVALDGEIVAVNEIFLFAGIFLEIPDKDILDTFTAIIVKFFVIVPL
jgi:hypothetical protein